MNWTQRPFTSILILWIVKGENNVKQNHQCTPKNMIDLCASGETDLESFVRYRRSVQQLSHPYLARTYIFSLGNRRWFGHSKNVKIEACVYPQTMQYHISKGAFLTLRLPSHGRRILSSSIQLRRRPQLQADWLWICGHMRPWRELGNSCGQFAFRNGLVLLLTKRPLARHFRRAKDGRD